MKKETGNNSLKKKRPVALMFMAAAVLIVLLTGVGIYNAPAHRLARQLELAYQYLEKERYEEAVIAFEEAIAIYDRLLELDSANETVTHDLCECLKQYIEVLKTARQYDIIRALAEKYGSVAVNVDFEAALSTFVELRFSPNDILSVAGYGVLDGNHLLDVAQAVAALMPSTLEVVFSDYTGWVYDELEGEVRISYRSYAEKTIYTYCSYYYDKFYKGVEIILAGEREGIFSDEEYLVESGVMPGVTTYKEALDALGISQIVEKAKEEEADEEGMLLSFQSQYGDTGCEIIAVAEEESHYIRIHAWEQNWMLSLKFKGDLLELVSIVENDEENGAKRQ